MAAFQEMSTVDNTGMSEKGHARASSPAPNRGGAIADVDAMPVNESVSAWRARIGINVGKQIHLTRLVHMRYQHPDLDEITIFLRDFGMHVVKRADDRIWYRGYGQDQYVYYAQKGPKKFLGGVFEVESMEDLEKAAKLQGSEIQELSDSPGGGHLVTLTDPEGFLVNLLYGAVPAEVCSFPEKIILNTESEKPRQRKFSRFQPGPAGVHKLGHYGLCVTKFDSQLEWYTSNFNIVPTDFLCINVEGGERKNVAVFAHIDRGDELVDHHCFFMSTNQTSHVHHCSFEVHDFDTQALGHQWLGQKGYKSVWGLGRHILGSQIFDYWWDTTGNMVEHYADGDLVNNQTPIGYGPAGDEGLAVWGPEVPKMFLK